MRPTRTRSGKNFLKKFFKKKNLPEKKNVRAVRFFFSTEYWVKILEYGIFSQEFRPDAHATTTGGINNNFSKSPKFYVI